MKVLVCGSRSWNDIEFIAKVFERLRGDITIIHGDAQGADTIANCVAEVFEFAVNKFPITNEDWQKFGRGAGPRRNAQMLSEGKPDVVLAFLDTLVDSPGTHNMIVQAESQNVRVITFRKECHDIIND